MSSSRPPDPPEELPFDGRVRGMVSNASSGQRVQARLFTAPDDLALLVSYLWTTSWDLRGQAPHRFQILGAPTADVVFEPAASRVVGVWTRMWERTLQDQGCMWAIKLRPGAGRAVLPSSMATYTDRITPLAEVWPSAEDPTERLLAHPDEAQTASALSDWLRGALRPHDEEKRTLATDLLQRVEEDSELLRAEQLAHTAGLGIRALQRLFSAYVGASPKWVIRRRRLQEAAQRVEAGSAEDLSELAFALGYADQAHLARDFKAAVGMPLRAFEQHLRS
ncbi:MAG: helix-turn-helix domain-containing protein [Myxococcales bacterium]|nr:helix-turn-helix domain-containing protein [Myxococcales bacterium]